MQIILNGKLTSVCETDTVASLIEQLGLSGKRIAVEINENVLPRSTHASRILLDGDRIEIVHAIGGG